MKYIQIDLKFIETSEPVALELSGSTLDDYYNGKYVLLTEAQEEFLQQNPTSTPEEAFRMVSAPTVEELFIKARRDKLKEIFNYDRSQAVNSFFINGLYTWLNRVARASLAFTISAYRAKSIPSITLWTTTADPVQILLTVEQLETLLVELEIYAKKCFDTTTIHKAAINSFETKEDLAAYDHTQGYPEILRFTF